MVPLWEELEPRGNSGPGLQSRLVLPVNPCRVYPLTLRCPVFSRYVRVVVLPCSENARCLFRTRAFPPKPSLEVNEVFGLSMSHNALRQKTLRVDVCRTSSSGRESCLVGSDRCLLPVPPWPLPALL